MRNARRADPLPEVRAERLPGMILGVSTSPGQPPPYPPYSSGPPGSPVWSPGSHPPPGPRRRRPSAWWFALPALLLVLAVASFPLLVLRAVDSMMETDARIAADGQPHAVTLADTGTRLIWAEEGTFPSCRVTDGSTGDVLALSLPTGTFERSSNGRSETGLQRFDPVSTTVMVSCGGNGAETVSVGPMPDVAGFVGTTLAAIGVPIVLGGLGLVALITLIVLFATGGPRTSRT